MSDSTQLGIETVEYVGQQWVKGSISWDDTKSSFWHAVNCVTIDSTAGQLMLANIYRVLEGPNAGKLRYRLVRPEEVKSPTKEEMLP